MITIFDLKTGNISSLKKTLDYLNIKNRISDNPEGLNKSSKIIIAGVGSFDNFILKLEQNNIIDELKYQLIEKEKPFLGICVGMQILLEKSEEGLKQGIGLIKGEVKKFNSDLNIRIPHMGWNYVKIKKNNDIINLNNQTFYFVHSYYPKVHEKNILATTTYGEEFPSIIGEKNIFGVQFHPEKSQKFGKELLKKFNDI
tara:strand:- start:210 stop:806 length:597 start_codon:yes stop_codon:yes gene_type:complete